MKATAWEFRNRFWIILAIYALGFTTPWDAALQLDGVGPNAHVWGWLAVALSRGGAMGISAAFNVVLAAAIFCAVVGAWLRTWGTATLSVDVMSDRRMHGAEVVAAGPYRYLRNPLYVGSWGNTLALAILMRPSGAAFTLLAIIAFQMRLILAEEAFLRVKLGETYAAYCAQVPRLWPRLRKPTSQMREVGHPVSVTGPDLRPEWGRAALAEIYMWGSAAGFAVLGWRYDANLLLQCVLVALGASLVVKGLRAGRGTTSIESA